MPKTYTVKQVADILGYSTNSIYTFLKEKRLKGVRVGKGRFRIPETELARVLHLSKKSLAPANIPTASVGTGSGPVLAAARLAKTDVGLLDAEEGQDSLFADIKRSGGWSLPNIFDWFVGVSALVSGVGLFLFNQTFEYSYVGQFLQIVPAIRIILISCGIGIIASDIIPRSAAWRKFFLLVFALIGAVSSYFLAANGLTAGAVLYGSLSLLVLVHVFVHLGGVVSLGLYLTALAVLSPLLFVFGKNSVAVTTYLDLTGLTASQGGLLFGATGLVFILLYWLGYKGVRYVFWIACLFMAVNYLAAAVFFGRLFFWSRSFFYLTLAFFTAFLPIWKALQQTMNRRERLVVHVLFGSVGVIFVLVLLVVRILQLAVWGQNKDEFSSKVAYATTLYQESLASVESTLLTAASNSELVDALVAGQESRILNIGKVMYESNRNIRRLVFLDADGDVAGIYPHGLLTQSNFSFREYFIRARDTGKPYTTNIFEALGATEKRKVMVISVPLYTQKKKFAGVLAASVDLLAINGKLQTIAMGNQGEYFIVTDEQQKIVIHPDTTKIGTEIAMDDVLRLGSAGQSGVVLDRMDDGTVGMVAYGPILKDGWAISLRAPAHRVYALSASALYTVFGVVGAVMVASVGGAFVMHMKLRHRVREASP